MESYSVIYRGKAVKIIILSLVVALLAGGITFLFPLQYSATARLLITQRAAFTLDPYTAIRSVELIGDNLAQIISTSSFYEKVIKSGYNIDENYFKKDETARRKQWSKMIEAGMQRGTGILEIKAYHTSSDQAAQIASAIVFVLNREGSDYMGRDIGIRLVDTPIVSQFPVKPFVPLNITAGFLLGLLLTHLWYYMRHRKLRHHGHMV